MTGNVLAIVVICILAFLLLSAWVHASAPYIALAIIAFVLWKLRGLLFPGTKGRSPDSSE
ncbi:hypothetical protein Axy04_054 [Achromobacter phage vB_AxyP_19-32_Axy04]|uniref:Uncharacterized protein n=2 Tax=Dongdastvirus TaxID=2842653 RepID=A0A0K2FHG4_9CAUD|nr:hypothetical protein ADP65_00053 [Achromobacter phage phiAxp-3]YP_010079022.1 hypothetical protein KMC55_gp60 [Achromobacter phage vB_AxyP_19-32_Axy04]ALA45522.1 hypothetical protein ADP65_00053 [Achromobacter phage phiAxp-3]QDH83801.1 hypothetical protein Axy04_054 [Achromobacter phage vB_AxyP_19-32_Axy04]